MTSLHQACKIPNTVASTKTTRFTRIFVNDKMDKLEADGAHASAFIEQDSMTEKREVIAPEEAIP